MAEASDRDLWICVSFYEIPYDAINLAHGQSLSKEKLYEYDGKGYTGFLVNVHETSTGVHYDIEMISEFCKKNNIFLVVDAISSFLADEFDMEKLGAGVMITGSQKSTCVCTGDFGHRIIIRCGKTY